MATYIWTGAISGDITAAANWASGVVPVSSPDTEVVIGHTPHFPDHTITNWPSGGHFSVEIDHLHIAPSWGLQVNTSQIIIGSSSNPLKFSKTKRCTWGGWESNWVWDDCMVGPNSETYIHMEQWADGPDSTLHIHGQTEEGTSSPHTPNATLEIWGNPKKVRYTRVRGMKITWNTATSNISGSTPTTAENGPQTDFRPNASVPWEGSGYGFINCVINLDWQTGTNGGNPIKDCVIDAKGSTVTISADTWSQGTSECLKLSSTYEGNQALTDTEGNTYTIKSSKSVGEETAAVDIPTLDLGGYTYTGQLGVVWENTTKLYIKTGVTIGGQATGTGFNCNLFDIIFSSEAAKNVVIKSGTIKWRSRIDASDLAPGGFKILDNATGGGVQLVPYETYGPFGQYATGPIKIKPPRYSNMRIA